MEFRLLVFFHMSVTLVSDRFSIIFVLCACNCKEVEVMQWRIEVDVLQKDMDIVQQRCHQLVTSLLHNSHD